MAIALSILYRGPLASCNYDCHYCPFAKRRDSPQQLALDRQQLERFVYWVQQRDAVTNVLFTPWGEALIRSWYRDAMTTLSRLPHVERVAIQTNLSCSLDWLAACDLDTLGLWCTYHPDEVDRQRFVGRCEQLSERGVRYSVGVVGLKEHFDEIEMPRKELPSNVYLWINASKRDADYYTAGDVDRLASIDPLFELNNRRHQSLGHACHAGESVISVDGDGRAKRCHFIEAPIGNIYDPEFESALHAQPCTAKTCGCHIGYVHLQPLDLYSVFGSGVLDRIPDRPVTRDDAKRRLRTFGQKADHTIQVSTTGL